MSPEGVRYGQQAQVSVVTASPERSRRIACSRCRGQKLRCERVGNDPTEASIHSVGVCKRCLKAGAKCDIDSPASGRPSRTGRMQRSPEGTRDMMRRTASHTPPRGHRRDGWSLLQRRTSGTANGKPKLTSSMQGLREYNDTTFETPSSTGTVFSSSGSSLGAPVISEDGSTLQEPHYSDSFIFEYGTNPSANSSDTWERNASDLLGMAVASSQTVIPTAGATSRSEPELGKLADTSDADTFMHIDFDPQLPSGTPAPHAHQTQFERTKPGSPGPFGGREQGVQRLLELSSSLLRDLSRIRRGKLTDTLSLSLASSPDGTSNITSATEGPARPYNAIGRILTSSERFLDILKHFTPQPSALRSPTRSSSVCSYSSDFDDGSRDDPLIVSQGERPQAPEDLRLCNHARASEIDTLAPEGSLRPDIPTALAILACYTYILLIYKTIFQHIYEYILRLDRSSQHSGIPNTLPGLQLGGFHLDGHHDLQIEVLILVSFRTLDTIHQTLGLPAIGSGQNYNNGGGGRTGGLLGSPLPAALLEVVLNQKGEEYSGGDAVGVVGLKATAERIRQLLRGTAI